MISKIGLYLRRVGIVKTAEADSKGLERLRTALGNEGRSSGFGIYIGNVEPEVFERLQRLNSAYLRRDVVVPKSYVRHLYNRRILHDGLKPREVTAILESLLNDKNPRVCESMRSVFDKLKPSDDGIREVLTQSRGDGTVNFGAFSPLAGLGNIGLHSVYTPSEDAFPRILEPKHCDIQAYLALNGRLSKK